MAATSLRRILPVILLTLIVGFTVGEITAKAIANAAYDAARSCHAECW